MRLLSRFTVLFAYLVAVPATAQTYTGEWSLASPTAISYSCDFLSLTVVSVSFGSIDIVDSAPTISTATVDSHPGSLNGTFSSPVDFTTQVTIGDGDECIEQYTLTGSFPNSTTLTGTLDMTFSGVNCGLSTCTNQSFPFSAVRVADSAATTLKLAPFGTLNVMNDAQTEEHLVVDEKSGEVKIMKPTKTSGSPRRGGLWSGGKLLLHDTGVDNVFVGPDAGEAQASDLSLGLGESNTGIGSESLKNNTDGSRNVAGGNRALKANTGGNRNTAVGTEALKANETGAFNSALGDLALSTNVSGVGNTGVGQLALNMNETTNENTAVGYRALKDNTAAGNTAVGALSLTANTTGVDNAAFGASALTSNDVGAGNSAFGKRALEANTTGNDNSAFGTNSLQSNTTGFRSAAFGRNALDSNVGGFDNSAFGWGSMSGNTGGNSNTAYGMNSLRDNSGGSDNVALGKGALVNNETGDSNIAIGYSAGDNLETGSNNIYIGSIASSTSESGIIRIGTSGTHIQTYLAGVTTPVAGSLLAVDGSGRVGVNISSQRYKHAVQDMENTSDTLARLRPVTFHYRDPGVGGGARQYGLIAEEVARVLPELVIYDGEGEPYSVRYDVLPALLLNELQRQQRVIEELRVRVEALERGPDIKMVGTGR